jgi:hypothetical protein
MRCRGKSRYCRRISDNGGVLTEKYRSTGLTREVEDRWCVACICAITILTIFGLQSRLQNVPRTTCGASLCHCSCGGHHRTCLNISWWADTRWKVLRTWRPSWPKALAWRWTTNAVVDPRGIKICSTARRRAAGTKIVVRGIWTAIAYNVEKYNSTIIYDESKHEIGRRRRNMGSGMREILKTGLMIWISLRVKLFRGETAQSLPRKDQVMSVAPAAQPGVLGTKMYLLGSCYRRQWIPS